jgi:Cu(I)/Ag(I) efflux system membrane fusion protein
MGCFNVMQGQSTLMKPTDSFSSEFDQNDFINAKVDFIEQLSETDKTNRIRVYLNNSNLKFPIGLRLQGIMKQIPFRVFGFRGNISEHW